MKYESALDLKERMLDIIKTLDLSHVDIDRIECIRSRGSSTKRVLARCHTIGKLMQKAMKVAPFYAIEFLEPFEKLSKKEQDKVIIHELLHVPKTFGGGFRQHDFVCDDNVDLMYEKFADLKAESKKSSVKEGFSPTKNWFSL